MRRILILTMALCPGLLMADDGRVLYVSGAVTVERGGQTYRAVKNARLLNGDTIETSASGRMHLRMSDRTLISLKPSTRFVIEEYRHAAAAPAERSRAARDDDEQDRSIFRLAKGGFRAITGLIGLNNKPAFGVNTPVATIGIRGTSFIADMEDAPDGRLTVGVGKGSVILSNAAGSLILENGEFGEVPGSGVGPRRLLQPLADSDADGGGGDDDTLTQQDEDTETQVATRLLEPGEGGGEFAPPEETVIEDTEFTQLDGPRRNLSVVSNLSGVNFPVQTLTATERTVQTDAAGHVDAFIGSASQGGRLVPAVYELSNGEVLDAGFAPDVNLRWGRWAGQSMTLRTAEGDTVIALDQAQLHLIQSAVRDGEIVTPTTGSQAFVLIGNTDPTHSNGAVGLLGSATFGANFDNQSVTSSLNLSVDDAVWNASGSGALGTGLSAGTPANVFAGQYDAVSVDGVGGGNGQFGGFLTDSAAGAGLSYQLNNGDQSVHGAAAFAAQNAGAP